MAVGYPLCLHCVSPGTGYTRIKATRFDGLPEGVHAGPFLSPDGKEVWKPLDVLPCPNADARYPSKELECLELMVGVPGFPKNWQVEEVNGRRWLIRDFAWIIKTLDDPVFLNLEQVMSIEAGVRKLNQRGWEINDLLVVALDRAGDLFILDLSAAHGGQKSTRWDEEWRIYQWFEQLGCDRLVKLRKDGRAVVGPLEWEHYDYLRNVYASRNRPMSSLWARIPGEHYFVESDYQEAGVWTWVVTAEPLPAEILERYELVWAWSPVK